MCKEKYRAVLSFKWFATGSCIQLIWHALRWQKSHIFSYQKCQKSRRICYAKMLKITLLLWKDFGHNFMLAEGLGSIPCLFILNQ